jgi:hypothetical protein
MSMPELPTEIEFRIWQIYFSEYVVKNIHNAWYSYVRAFHPLPRWIYVWWNPPPPRTGKFVKFAWEHPRPNCDTYIQELQEWIDYNPCLPDPFIKEEWFDYELDGCLG